jgi:hypothetical protein
MAKKQRKAASAIETKILDTLRAEIEEAVELQRPYFPDDDDDALRARAEAWRSKRYANGSWPDFAEVAKAEAAEAAAAEAAAKAADAMAKATQSATTEPRSHERSRRSSDHCDHADDRNRAQGRIAVGD